MQAAAANWVVIDGERAKRGLPNILRLRPDRFFNFMLLWALERIPADDREMWLAMLERPLDVPKGASAIAARAAAPTPQEAEAEMQEFAALYAQMKSGG